MTASDILLHGLETTFWVSALTILALALRAPVTKRFGSRAAMLVWLIPGLRLVAPVLPREVIAEPPAVLPSEPIVSTPVRVETVPAEWVARPAATPETASTPASMPLSEPAPVSTSFSLPEISPEMMAALVLSLWFAGVMVALALCWARSASWRRTLLAEAKDVPDNLSDLAVAMAKRAGADKAFTLVVSGAADTPQLMGLRDPLLAVPQDFCERYSEDEQEMALLHELTHLKRGDLSILMASEAAFALQWFNPLTSHARKAMRSDQEAACDEAVRALGVNTKSYAALLVKAASIGRPVPALTLDHSLKERIIRMQSPLSAPLKRYAFFLLAGASALAVAGFTASRTDIVVEHPHTEEDNRQEEVQEKDEQELRTERALEALLEADAATDKRSKEISKALEKVRAADMPEDERREVIRALEKEMDHAKRDREHRARDMERVRREAERAQERAQREIERAERERLRAEREIERSQARAESRAYAMVHAAPAPDAPTVLRLHNQEGNEKADRQVIVTAGQGNPSTIKILLSEDGEVLNRDELEAFTKKHGIKLDIQQRANGKVSYNVDTRGVPVNISKAEPVKGLRYAYASDAKNVHVISKDDNDGVHVNVSGHGKQKMSGFVQYDDEETMVLLSDPFADIEMPDVEPPQAPKVEIKAPKIQKRKTEEGTWLLIPDEPDMSEFENAMDAFGEEMEEFGERMGEFGERMGAVGEAIEDLADDCEDHREDSDAPKLLSAKVDDSDQIVRAVCATGGAERFRSEEMMRFVERQRLSSEEKAYFRKSVRDN